VIQAKIISSNYSLYFVYLTIILKIYQLISFYIIINDILISQNSKNQLYLSHITKFTNYTHSKQNSHHFDTYLTLVIDIITI